MTDHSEFILRNEQESFGTRDKSINNAWVRFSRVGDRHDLNRARARFLLQISAFAPIELDYVQ